MLQDPPLSVSLPSHSSSSLAQGKGWLLSMQLLRLLSMQLLSKSTPGQAACPATSFQALTCLLYAACQPHKRPMASCWWFTSSALQGFTMLATGNLPWYAQA